MTRAARWLAWQSIALALVLMVAVSGRAGAADDFDKSLAAKFVTGVHRDSILAAPTRKLSRWTAPVRLATGGRQNATWQPRIRAILAEMAAATGHEFTMPAEAPYNAAILFADGFVADAERVPVFKWLLQNAVRNPTFVAVMAEADREGSPCFWTNFRNDAGALVSGVLMVAERAPRRTQDFCVFGWLAGISGFTAWFVDPREVNMMMLMVMLDDGPDDTATLSKTGRQLLRMIYDRRLRDGMGVDETLPLLRQIVEDPR